MQLWLMRASAPSTPEKNIRPKNSRKSWMSMSTELSIPPRRREHIQKARVWERGFYGISERDAGKYASATSSGRLSSLLCSSLHERISQTDLNPGPGPQYNASKAGVLQLAKSLAVEWVGFCRVNCVSPGYVQTNMMEYASPSLLEKWLGQIPARRFASPYEFKGVSVHKRCQ